MAAKRPVFSLVAIATLAIGIGASTATFSIADAVLMRPLPVHEQRNLSVLWGVDRAVRSRHVPVPYGSVQGIRGRLAEDALRCRRRRLSRRLQHSRARGSGRREPEGHAGHRESVQRARRHSPAWPQPSDGGRPRRRGAGGRDQLRPVAAPLREGSFGARPRAHDSRAAGHDCRGDASRLRIPRPDGSVGDGASVPPRRGERPARLLCVPGRPPRAWRHGRTVGVRAHELPPKQRRAASVVAARHDRFG